MSAIERAVPVLYLDLDGTVREGKDDALGRFVNGPDDVRVFPEAVRQMRVWKARGGRIIGVSNAGRRVMAYRWLCRWLDREPSERELRRLFRRLAVDPYFGREYARQGGE